MYWKIKEMNVESTELRTYLQLSGCWDGTPAEQLSLLGKSLESRCRDMVFYHKDVKNDELYLFIFTREVIEFQFSLFRVAALFISHSHLQSYMRSRIARKTVWKEMGVYLDTKTTVFLWVLGISSWLIKWINTGTFLGFFRGQNKCLSGIDYDMLIQTACNFYFSYIADPCIKM